MTRTAPSRHDDWVVPAILVAVVVVIAAVVGVVFGVRAASSGEATLAEQFETWSRCLRSEGVPVPLVEALRGDGFRITFDGSILDGEIDTDAVRDALAACRDDAPERIREVVDKVRQFGGLSLGSGLLGLGRGLFEIGRGWSSDDDSSLLQPERRHLDEMCEQLDEGGFDAPKIPRRLREVCERRA